MDKKTITKETHTKCGVRIIKRIEADFEFLVPNHLVDEDKCLDEEFSKKMSGLVMDAFIGIEDCDHYDDEWFIDGDYRMYNDFDPDLPVAEDLIEKFDY